MDFGVDNRLFTVKSAYAGWNNSIQGASIGSPLITLNVASYDSRYKTSGSIYPLSLILNYAIKC